MLRHKNTVKNNVLKLQNVYNHFIKITEITEITEIIVITRITCITEITCPPIESAPTYGLK